MPGHDLEFIMGPLSQMAHGLLFRCLGPSLLWIIIANFVVVLLVTTGLYVLGHLQPVPHARWLGLLLGGMFLGISAFAQLRQVAVFC